MAKSVIINGNIYPDAPYVDIPKSDSSGDARFYDTTDATATAAHTLAGDTFYNDGLKTGTMPNNGDTSGTISTKNGTVSIPSGYTSGGGGDSKNAQTAQSTTRSTSTSYTEVVTLTCTKTGTYNVYWSTFRSSTSGTWGSQLYLDNTAYGSAQTGSWSNHIQNIHLSNVQIDANEEVAVRVRSRGSNYYGYVGTLTIIEV